MNKILDAVILLLIILQIFQTKNRLKWDKNILKQELLGSHNNFCINYIINKGILNMNNRDFVDKQIKFSENGKFYCYFSNVPNDDEVIPIPNKHDRAKTILGVQRMERREDGKIVYHTFMQGDVKIKVTPKLIAMFLPSGIQDWVKRLNKYLQENYEKI